MSDMRDNFEFSTYPCVRLFYEELVEVANSERMQIEALEAERKQLKNDPATFKNLRAMAEVIVNIAATQAESYAYAKHISAKNVRGASSSVAVTFWEMLPEIRQVEKALQDEDIENAGYITMPDVASEEDFMEALLLASHATGFTMYGIAKGAIAIASPWSTLTEVREDYFQAKELQGFGRIQ